MKHRSTKFQFPMIIFCFTCLCILGFSNLGGCAYLQSEVSTLQGSISGNTYTARFYDHYGENTMTIQGENIDINENIIRERSYSDGSWGYVNTLSSVITLTIDGFTVDTCGDTIIFAEDGLEPDVNYMEQDYINSQANGIEDYTIFANTVNRYKNMYGKSRVVVIKSQLGIPICSFSGDSVYTEVCEDLPKTTKLLIDGKLLYIHRATFSIIDKDLLQ